MKNFLSSVTMLCMMGLTFGLNSCSDDTTTTPTPSADIMPMKTGSHYVYSNTRLDSLTGNPDLTKVTEDSVVVGTSSTKDGKTAFAFDVYRLNQKLRTDYYAKEGQTIWGYWQFIPPGITLTDLINTIIPQSRRWSKFADYSASTEWTIADTNITGVSIPFSGINIPTSAVITMKGKKLTTTSEILNGINYANTTKFEIALTITPTVEFSIPPNPPSKIPLAPIVVKQYVWVANNVGIIKEEFPNVDISISGLGTPIVYKADGLRRELLRYTIK